MYLNNTWCLSMSEYANICVNVSKYAWIAFDFHVPIVTLCLLERVVTYFSGFELLSISAKMFLFTKDPILDTGESSECALAYIEFRQPIFIMSYIFQRYSFVVFLSAIIQHFDLIQKGVTIFWSFQIPLKLIVHLQNQTSEEQEFSRKKCKKRAFYPIAAFTYLVLGKS